MNPARDLFQDFGATSDEQWVAALQKQLKGKPLDSLTWEITPSLRLEPRPRTAPADPVVGRHLPQPAWAIVETIPATADPAADNQRALAALAGGATAIAWRVDSPVFEPAAWEARLAGVWVEMIELLFLDVWPLAEAENLLEWLHRRCPDAKGAIALAEIPPAAWVGLAPRFSWHWLPEADSEADPARNLADLLLQLTRLAAGYARLEDFLPRVRLGLRVGNRFLVEVAKLRALKKLLHAWAAAYGVSSSQLPAIQADTRSILGEDIYLNMIACTTQAMAAAIGQPDALHVVPADPAATAFSRRIARNVHHLLAEESHLQRVHDPAAGAHALESLTAQLVESGWKLFLSDVEAF